MLEIFLQLLPLFSMICVGYILGITKIGTLDWVKMLNLFGYYAAFPALVLHSLSNSTISLATHGLVLLIQVAIAITLLLGTYVLLGWLKVGQELRNVYTIGIYFSNAAYIGLPAIERVFGETMAAEAAVVVVVMIIATLTLGLGLIDRDANGKVPLKQLVLDIVRNPLIWSAIIGGAVSLAGITLPNYISDSVALLAGSASPTVLVALGIFLALNHPTIKTLKESFGLVSLKMLILPGIFTLVMWLLPNSDWLDVTYIQFAMPVAVTTFAFAEIYPMKKSVVSTSLVLSTLLSIIVLPLVMWLSTVL